MTEMAKIIAEAEGIKTPTKKRSLEDVKNAYNEFEKKKATRKAKGSAKASKSAKDRKATPKPAPARNADAKPKTTIVHAEQIKMNFISATGYVREAAFAAKTNLFYVAFAKSTWAMPSNAKEWADFEAAVADPKVDIDAYYRKMARGRTAEMQPVKHQEVSK